MVPGDLVCPVFLLSKELKKFAKTPSECVLPPGPTPGSVVWKKDVRDLKSKLEKNQLQLHMHETIKNQAVTIFWLKILKDFCSELSGTFALCSRIMMLKHENKVLANDSWIFFSKHFFPCKTYSRSPLHVKKYLFKKNSEFFFWYLFLPFEDCPRLLVSRQCFDRVFFVFHVGSLMDPMDLQGLEPLVVVNIVAAWKHHFFLSSSLFCQVMGENWP